MKRGTEHGERHNLCSPSRTKPVWGNGCFEYKYLPPSTSALSNYIRNNWLESEGAQPRVLGLFNAGHTLLGRGPSKKSQLISSVVKAVRGKKQQQRQQRGRRQHWRLVWPRLDLHCGLGSPSSSGTTPRFFAASPFFLFQSQLSYESS